MNRFNRAAPRARVSKPVVAGLALTLAGCGSSPAPGGAAGAVSAGTNGATGTGTPGSTGITGNTGFPIGTITPACANPMAPVATNYTITDNVPINLTVLLPTRCPGDHFLLVLQSHGFSGSRLKTVAANGTLDPTVAHFASIDNLAMALPYHGYVVISFDERGQSPTNVRTIDPAAETVDAKTLLD